MALGQASSCLSSGFRWWRCLGLGRVHKTRHSLVYDVKHGRCHVSVELLAMDAPGWRQLGPVGVEEDAVLQPPSLSPTTVTAPHCIHLTEALGYTRGGGDAEEQRMPCPTEIRGVGNQGGCCETDMNMEVAQAQCGQ